MIKIESHVQGLAELDRFLATLPDEIQRKMLASSLMKAADPIVRQAQQNVANIFGSSEDYTGTLEHGITRGRTKKTGLAARVNIKLKKGRTNEKMHINGVLKQHGLDPFYGRFLEFGRGGGVAKSGRKVAPMPARPWLKPAGMMQQDEAGRELNKALQKQIALWCKRNGVQFKPGV